MRVRIDGQREVTLGPGEFVAAGGEGKVYAVDDRAIKVFDDPKLAPPTDKLRRLAQVGDPRVVAPDGPVTDRRSRVVGFSMPFVESLAPLARVCTPSFQRRQRLSRKRLTTIADAMREVIVRVHAASLVIVDLSDNNVLLGVDRRTPYFIDVDSWQTPDHTATAITASIRDPLASGPRFDPSSDWFSYGVLMFSMLVGIHPFKGKHPMVKPLAERMKRGLSVFDADVRVPPACRDLSILPADFGQWCRELFSHRHRDPPPPLRAAPRHRSSMSSAAPSTATGVSFDATILDVATWQGHDFVLTQRSLWVDGQRLCPRPDFAAGLWAAAGDPGRLAIVHHDPDASRVWLSFPSSSEPELEVPCRADEICIRPGALLVRSPGQVLEIALRRVGSRTVVQTKLRVRVMPRSSHLFDGLVWQSIEGRTFLSVLAPGAAPQLRVPELDGATPIDAAFVENTIVVLTTREGRYDQWTVKLAGAKHSAVCKSDVHPGEIAWAHCGCQGVVWSTPAYVRAAPPPPAELMRTGRGHRAGPLRPVEVAGGIAWVSGRILVGPPPPDGRANATSKRPPGR